MAWRLTTADWRSAGAAGRKEAFKALVDAEAPTGLLAYLDGEAVGWCSVAPRTSFQRLVRSRTLLPGDDRPSSALTCFFIRYGYRRTGVATALLEAAVDHVAEQGAAVLEAYPNRNTRSKPGSGGGIAMFKDAGFEEAPTRSTFFVPMRRELRGSS